MRQEILDEIAKQSQKMGLQTFICATCRFYLGGCTCKKNIFIAFEGGNLFNCQLWEPGKRCRHCGLIT